MKLLATLFTALLATSLAAASSTCSKDTAHAWPSPGGGGDSCHGDPQCEQLLHQGECNALEGDCVQKRKRGSFKCEDNETCFLYTNGYLLCLDVNTGQYVDELGGHGNAISGAHTAADGSVQTNTGTTPGTIATKQPSKTASLTTITGTRLGTTVAAVTGGSSKPTATGSQTQQTGGASSNKISNWNNLAILGFLPMVAGVM